MAGSGGGARAASAASIEKPPPGGPRSAAPPGKPIEIEVREYYVEASDARRWERREDRRAERAARDRAHGRRPQRGLASRYTRWHVYAGIAGVAVVAAGVTGIAVAAGLNPVHCRRDL